MNDALSTLVGMTVNDPRTVIVRGFAGKSTETANCLIKASSVYSICRCKILAITQSPRNDGWCVTTYISADRWVRYCGLSSVGVLNNQIIDKGTLIGYGTNGQMQLEYCTPEKSNYPVRMLGTQLYKHNPTSIIFTKQDISEVE